MLLPIMETPFEKLVRVIGKGSQAELARKVGEAAGRAITPQAVAKWETRIPGDRVYLLSILSREAGEEVTPEAMRPDLFRIVRAA